MLPSIDNPEVLAYLNENERELMGQNTEDVLNIYPRSGEEERELQREELFRMLPGLNKVLALEPLLEAPHIFDKPST